MEGIKVSQDGGDFGRGFARGWIDGVKVGGTVGLVADIATGWGLSTYNGANLFFKMMASSYLAAWQGQAGGSFSGGFGGEANVDSGIGGAVSLRNKIAEDPGTYIDPEFSGPLFSPTTGTATSPYGWRRRHPVTGQRKFHTGIDYSRGDDLVRARRSGIVRDGGVIDGYDQQVSVEWAPNYYSRYAHLVANSWPRPGTFVFAGEIVGRIYPYSTPNSTGPHLHYEEYTYSGGVPHYYAPRP